VISHFHHCIEQLDLTAEQFQRRSSAYSRFALILTDNVLELLLHRFAEQELKWDEMSRMLGRQKYSANDKAKVLGQYFEEKPKFARKLGALSELEMTFVLICHRYRNELYHQGMMHESVIFDIAWHYHDLVCDLMPRMQRGAYRWRMGESISPAVQKYCGEEGLSRDPHSLLPEVAGKLRAAKPNSLRSFALALSDAAIARVKELDGNIEFLIADSPKKRTRRDVIFDVQAWPFLLSDESKGSIELQPGEAITSFNDAFDLLRKRWKPPISKDPVYRWKVRGIQLRHETSVLKVLVKYQQLMDQMEDFDQKVRDAAIALDQQIQLAIDRHRGK
jgi:hypothetical protein